ncbi:MAG TPA: squalene synthase HpnC [Burkholderiales bacterium]|nr:squalene synthase HpnC [Burkholderiales bacterium]
MAVNHYENFPVASLLLPRALRSAVALIYRFAREADDFADEGEAQDAERLARLEHYREQIVRIGRGEAPDIPWFAELAAVIERHRLPLAAFLDLLSAFAQDVTKKRYASFEEVLDYCRRSANPVGRLLLHLFDRATPRNCADSDSICSALQLVNFWQDVASDYARGRVYLPRDEMERFGVSERHLAERRCDEAWRALIGFQIARARAMLRAGAPLGRALPGRIGLEIRATVEGGLRILEKIESARCDVFRHRPVLTLHDWPVILWRAL